MLRSIQPLQFLLTLLAGWINRRQLEAGKRCGTFAAAAHREAMVGG
jgi:hypothetical protein